MFNSAISRRDSIISTDSGDTINDYEMFDYSRLATHRYLFQVRANK